MKNISILLLLLWVQVYSQHRSSSVNGYTLTNITPLTPRDGYSAPKWSPDGNKMLFTKLNYTGLFVLDLKTKELVGLNMLRGAGFNATWSDDSKSIYYRQKTSDKKNRKKTRTEVKSVNIASREITDQPNVEPNSIASTVRAKSKSDVVVYLDQNTLMVKAHKTDGSKDWNITNDGQYYGYVLSPDKTKIVVDKKDEMFVYAIDGSGLICSLGRGIAGSWSSDGEKILFYVSKDDGHAITGSELYMAKSDGSQRWQLTNTPDVFEEWPDWSPDNKQIVFADIKTGVIYVADLLEKREMIK